MPAGRAFEGEADDAQLAGPADDAAARALLLGLDGGEFRNRMRRARDGGEVLADGGESGGFGEVAGDGHGAVVRPVERVVEGAEFFHRHVLDVGAPADDRVVVGVGDEGGGPERLVERQHRGVFAVFEFVAHDCHLRGAVFLAQAEVAHVVGEQVADER